MQDAEFTIYPYSGQRVDGECAEHKFRLGRPYVLKIPGQRPRYGYCNPCLLAEAKYLLNLLKKEATT